MYELFENRKINTSLTVWKKKLKRRERKSKRVKKRDSEREREKNIPDMEKYMKSELKTKQ